MAYDDGGAFTPLQVCGQHTVATGQSLIAAPGVGKRIVIDYLEFSNVKGTSTTYILFTFKSGTNIIGYAAASGQANNTSSENLVMPRLGMMCNENEAFILDVTGTATLTTSGYYIRYHIQQ